MFNPKTDRFESLGRRLATLLFVLLGSLAHADPAEPGVPTKAAGGSRPGIEAQRASLQREAKRLQGWQLAETKNFFLLTDAHDAHFVEELKLRLEAIQLVFENDFPASEARLSPQKKRSPKALVRLYRCPNEYNAAGGPLGSAGYWSPINGELVLQAQAGQQGLRKTWSTLNHEAFHQYIFYHMGELTPHTWYGEGLGDFYGTYVLVQGHYVRPGKPFTHAELWDALDSGEYAGLREFIHWTKGEYYGTNALGLPRSLAYAQGYSLIYFLRSGTELFPPGWQNSWERILPHYQETFSRTGRPDQALNSAFDGVNLIALENCWKNFLLTS